MATIFSERMFTRFEAELGPCADKLGIPRALFHRQDVEYSIESYFQLLECAADHGCPDIGFRVGSTAVHQDIGAIGHAAGAAQTVGEALYILSRYLFVLAHGNILRVHAGRDKAIVFWGYTQLYAGTHEQDSELAMSLVAGMVRSLSGSEESHPRLVEFTHPRPSHADKLEAYFGCPVRFSCRAIRLHYPRKCLDQVNQNADHSLLEALEFYLSDRLKLRAEEANLLDKLRHFISASLIDGAPDIGAIANLLGMSRRTLQRRLADEDVVFSALVEQTRQKLAVEYVKHTDFSLTEISLMLGYSELSAFSRAFRRWTGASPQQTREDTSNNDAYE